MKIYNRHIIRSLIFPFVAICFGLTSLVWLTQVLRLISLLDKGIGVTSFLSLTLLITPSLLFVIVPIALFCSVMYIYQRMHMEREIIIYETSTLSYWQLAKPAVSFACYVTIFSYVLSFYLLPYSNNRLKANIQSFRNNFASALIQEQSFNSITKFITVFVSKKNSHNELQNVILFDNRKKNKPIIMLAEKAKIMLKDNMPFCHLTNGHRQTIDANGMLETLHFDNLTISLVSRRDVVRRNKELQSRYMHELFFVEDRGEPLRNAKLIAEGNQRIIWPLMNIIVTILVLSIFIPGERNTRRSNNKILIASGLVVVFIMSNFILSTLSHINAYFHFIIYLNLLIPLIPSYFLFKRKSL